MESDVYLSGTAYDRLANRIALSLPILWRIYVLMWPLLGNIHCYILVRETNLSKATGSMCNCRYYYRASVFLFATLKRVHMVGPIFILRLCLSFFCDMTIHTTGLYVLDTFLIY